MCGGMKRCQLHQVIISDKSLSVGTELIPNTTDAAGEKHVPVITVDGDSVHVAVAGSFMKDVSI